MSTITISPLRQRYTRVATGMIASVKSPLDQLSGPRKRPKHGRKEQSKDQPPA